MQLIKGHLGLIKKITSKGAWVNGGTTGQPLEPSGSWQTWHPTVIQLHWLAICSGQSASRTVSQLHKTVTCYFFWIDNHQSLGKNIINWYLYKLWTLIFFWLCCVISSLRNSLLGDLKIPQKACHLPKKLSIFADNWSGWEEILLFSVFMITFFSKVNPVSFFEFAIHVFL